MRRSDQTRRGHGIGKDSRHHGHDVVVRIIHAVLLTRLHDKSFAPA